MGLQYKPDILRQAEQRLRSITRTVEQLQNELKEEYNDLKRLIERYRVDPVPGLSEKIFEQSELVWSKASDCSLLACEISSRNVDTFSTFVAISSTIFSFSSLEDTYRAQSIRTCYPRAAVFDSGNRIRGDFNNLKTQTFPKLQSRCKKRLFYDFYLEGKNGKIRTKNLPASSFSWESREILLQLCVPEVVLHTSPQ